MNNLVRFISLTLIALLLYPEATTLYSAGDFFIVEKVVYRNPPEREISKTEFECLAKNIYFEAAVESTAGKLAVANVTRNRVMDEKYPNTYCGVVKQGKLNWKGNPIRHRCQFSWHCDGKPDIPYKGKQWQISKRIAFYVLTDYNNSVPDITDGATHYHATYVNPWWSGHLRKVVRIGTHIFYK